MGLSLQSETYLWKTLLEPYLWVCARKTEFYFYKSGTTKYIDRKSIKTSGRAFSPRTRGLFFTHTIHQQPERMISIELLTLLTGVSSVNALLKGLGTFHVGEIRERRSLSSRSKLHKIDVNVSSVFFSHIKFQPSFLLLFNPFTLFLPRLTLNRGQFPYGPHYNVTTRRSVSLIKFLFVN